MPADKLRADILDDMHYIRDNFGSPGHYYHNYGSTNLCQNKINEKIDRFRVIRAVLLENPEKARALYELTPARTNEKNTKDETGFAKFYRGINDSALPFYGEPRPAVGGQVEGVFYSYTHLKDQIFWIMILFEKGAIKHSEFVEEYSRKAGKQPEQKYTA